MHKYQTYTFTYKPLILRHVSSSSNRLQAVLHHTNIYKTQKNNKID